MIETNFDLKQNQIDKKLKRRHDSDIHLLFYEDPFKIVGMVHYKIIDGERENY